MGDFIICYSVSLYLDFITEVGDKIALLEDNARNFVQRTLLLWSHVNSHRLQGRDAADTGVTLHCYRWHWSDTGYTPLAHVAMHWHRWYRTANHTNTGDTTPTQVTPCWHRWHRTDMGDNQHCTDTGDITSTQVRLHWHRWHHTGTGDIHLTQVTSNWYRWHCTDKSDIALTQHCN